ncbi:hypothetical protein [Vibrio harveyi]|uniref:hypothetical protein n=1 Tax=Vibrio harveyi TaxID=669 RepID=UPI003BB7BBE8
MKKLKSLTVLITVLFVGTANASIAISSMIEFTENGTSDFYITNIEDYRQFIHVQARELKVNQKGELTTIPYTRENLEQWSLFINPARAIVEPAGKKTFRVSYRELAEHDASMDKAYQLSFIPTPYFGESNEKNSAVQIAVGFAPYVIVPGSEDQPLNFSVRHNGESLSVENRGKTYIRGFLDACPADLEKIERDGCQKMVYVLAGRKMEVVLPESMQGKFKVNFSTHYSKFKQRFEIGVGEHKEGEKSL